MDLQEGEVSNTVLKRNLIYAKYKGIISVLQSVS